MVIDSLNKVGFKEGIVLKIATLFILDLKLVDVVRIICVKLKNKADEK